MNVLAMLWYPGARWTGARSYAVMGSVEKSHLGVIRSVGQALSMGIATLIIAEAG